MNRREHAVLSLFYDEGHRELTPSFLAYRMRMRTGDATDLLDDMVREGILDLHIEDDGHISYQLPPDEQIRRSRHADAARSHHSPNFTTAEPSASPPTGGTDAAIGYAPNHDPWAGTTAHRRNAIDGTDGTVAPRGPVLGTWTHSNPVVSSSPVHPETPDHGAHHPLAPYGHATQLTSPQPPPQRIPVVAGALSLLFPGLGQFYNGEIGKGILLLFSTAFLAFFLLFWVVWIWSVIDAYMVAEYQNHLNAQTSDHPGGLLPEGRNSNTNSPAA